VSAGQAIVGNVKSAGPGGKDAGKDGEQPHALAYAPGVEMPRQIKAKGAAVPRAGSAGPKRLSNAWGAPRCNRNALKHGDFTA
jgi:hypothetical protein